MCPVVYFAYVPTKISSSTSALVIQKWLEGKPRDIIAQECGLSGGAVSAIISRWRYLVGFEYADQLRELAVALRKCGYSVLELADAVRLRNMMNRLGIDEESTSEFLSEIYNTCVEIGIQPHQIARYLGDLVTFSLINSRNIEKRETKTSGLIESLPTRAREEEEEEEEREELEEGKEQGRYGTKQILFFSQLPEYMAKLKEEKVRLQDDIRELRRKCNLVEDQYALLKNNKDELLKSHNMVEEQLKWYEEIKAELRKFGFSVDVIPQFVKSVRWIQEAGYPVAAITANFLNYLELQQSSQALELEISQNQKRSEELDQRITFLEELAQKHSLKNTEIDALKEMGFGYKELKRLRHTIEEISEANKFSNNIVIVDNSPDAANSHVVNKFLRDIEADYDDVLGFKQTRDQLQKQIQNLTFLRKEQQQGIGAIPHIGSSIVSLFQKGITEDQFLNMLANLNKYPNTIESISNANTEDSPSQSASSTEFKGNISGNGPLNNDKNSLASEPKIITHDPNSLEITLPIDILCASGFEGQNVPTNAIDGNFETYWSDKGEVSWLLLDLRANSNVRRINISWYQGRIYDSYCEIFLSDDLLDFKRIKNSTSSGYATSSFMEYNLEQGSQGKYIKIVVNGNNSNLKWGISEIAVIGSHLQ